MARTVDRCVALAGAALMAAGTAVAGPLPDPTRPPSAADGTVLTATPDSPAGFVVTSILFAPARRNALLNGQMVHEGSMLGAVRVQRIERDAVFIDVGGQSRRLPIYTDTVHKPVKVPAALPALAAKERNHD